MHFFETLASIPQNTPKIGKIVFFWGGIFQKQRGELSIQKKSLCTKECLGVSHTLDITFRISEMVDTMLAKVAKKVVFL